MRVVDGKNLIEGAFNAPDGTVFEMSAAVDRETGTVLIASSRGEMLDARGAEILLSPIAALELARALHSSSEVQRNAKVKMELTLAEAQAIETALDLAGDGCPPEVEESILNATKRVRAALEVG